MMKMLKWESLGLLLIIVAGFTIAIPNAAFATCPDDLAA